MDQKGLCTELQEQLDKLIQLNTLIIVEGKEDKAALKRLGIVNIIVLNKALYKVVEDVVESGEREVLILTDLDKEGKELYGKLNHQLCQFGIKVNNKFREFLFQKTKLRQIEGLWNYYLRLEKSSRVFVLESKYI